VNDFHKQYGDITSLIDKCNSIDVFSHGTAIPAGANLDIYLTPGKYYSADTATTSTITGKPSSLAAGFSLEVLGQGKNGIMQVATQNTDRSNCIFFRINANGVFSSWYLVNATVQS